MLLNYPLHAALDLCDLGIFDDVDLGNQAFDFLVDLLGESSIRLSSSLNILLERLAKTLVGAIL